MFICLYVFFFLRAYAFSDYVCFSDTFTYSFSTNTTNYTNTNCSVLLLRGASEEGSTATASVLDPKNGRLVSEYQHQVNHNDALQGRRGGAGNDVMIGGQVGGGDDVLGGGDGGEASLESHNNSQLTLSSHTSSTGNGAAAATGGTNPITHRSHSWKFAGFLVEFDPAIWELRVRFGNERMVRVYVYICIYVSLSVYLTPTLAPSLTPTPVFPPFP